MFNEKKDELDIQEIIARNKREIEKLEEKYSKLTEETDALYERVGVSREELKNFLADPANFTSQSWKNLQKYNEDKQMAYERDIENIKNAVDKEKRFKELNLPYYSIFVR